VKFMKKFADHTYVIEKLSRKEVGGLLMPHRLDTIPSHHFSKNRNDYT